MADPKHLPGQIMKLLCREVHLYFECFGILPFNLNRPRSSISDYILIIIIPVVYVALYLLTIFYLAVSPQASSCKNICFLVDSFFMYTGVCIYAVIQLRIFPKKGFFLKFQYIMDEIDDELKKCNSKIQLPRKTRFEQIFLGLGCTCFIMAMAFDGYITTISSSPISLLFTFCADLPYVLVCIFQGQFICLVHEVALRFDDLNNVLETISEQCDSKCERLRIFDIETEFDKKTTKLVKDTKDKEAAVEQKNERKDTERFLVDVFKLHEKLCSVSVLANNEYALEIVCYMTSTFIINVFGIFLETKVIFIVGGQNRYFDFLATSYIIWGVIFLLVAYMVLRLCCRVMRESKRSALLVHEIMQKKPAFMLGNDIYYNRMKGFTLQYLHWESYFYFNGIGLFPLDYTFIFSAISAATSYLIVLLQFDLNSIM